MTPKEVIQKALKESFEDDQGNTYRLQLNPGLTETELENLSDHLFGRPLPSDARELLTFTSRFTVPQLGQIDFRGNDAFEFADLLPGGVPLAGDGCGNFWVLDVRADTGKWGPVFFASHDPPVIVVQAPHLAAFLDQVLDLGRPNRENMLRYVIEEATSRLSAKNPHALDVEDASRSPGDLLSSFAKQLADNFWVADLRALERFGV